MCLVQSVQNGPILTKSLTYSPWFFLKNEPFLTRKKNPNLSIYFEKPYKELLTACFNFEIRHSKLKL